MSRLKSQFVFNAQQRLGILLLLSLSIGLLCFYFYVDVAEEQPWDVSAAEILQLQDQLDSLQLVELERRKPKLYPFNPNYITDYKAYALGMSTEAYDKLKNFRKQGQWVNNSADFKRVTGVTDSVLRVISPYFKFPEWVTNPKPKRKQFINKLDKELSFVQKTDLNTATEAQLQKVYGIGPALSKRIVGYRKKIDGFAADSQLYSVWGLRDSVVERTLRRFTVKTPREIHRFDVNVATASDIATIPGISFDLAKQIWEFRILHERIESLSDLKKIDRLTVSKFKLIELYLYVAQN